MREEDDKERHDRELIELLTELRVAITGVQVLFAFLLTVPFSQRFQKLPDSTVRVYFTAVLLSAAASILLIAPSAHHRLNFRRGTKEQLLRTANGLALAGTIVLACAIGVVVYLIADVVYGSSTARIAGGVVGVAAAGLWFVFPLLRYRKGSDNDLTP